MVNRWDSLVESELWEDWADLGVCLEALVNKRNQQIWTFQTLKGSKLLKLKTNKPNLKLPRIHKFNTPNLSSNPNHHQSPNPLSNQKPAETQIFSVTSTYKI